jgi:hypothetical protein
MMVRPKWGMKSRSRCESGTATRVERRPSRPYQAPGRLVAHVVMRELCYGTFDRRVEAMIGKAPRRWSSAKAQSEISEPNPYRARNRQPQIIDDGVQPKPAIFALSRACIARGTGSSNPSPSTEESANFQSLTAKRYRAAIKDRHPSSAD